MPSKSVKGFENYTIYSTGQIHNSRRKLNPYPDKEGYLIIDLSKEGKRKTFKMHRLIAEHFIPNPLDLPEVNHKDKCTYNNDISNLEWCTRIENAQHAHHGEHYIQSPEGQIHKFNGIRQFCREQNLGPSSISNLLRGIIKGYKGWTLSSKLEQIKQTK